MSGPFPEELIEETARLAYHMKWPLDGVLDLEHRDRAAFLGHAAALAGRG